MEIHDPAVLEALEHKVGHAAPYMADELAGVGVLRIHHARDVSALAALTGVRTLTLVGCEVPDLEPLRGHTSLRRLDVSYCSVHDVSALAECPALAHVTLACDAITDLAPLVALPSLQELDVTGNPLSDDSFRAHVPVLRERCEQFTASGEEEWELTRGLHQRGLRASYYRDGDVYRLCAPGLAFKQTPEAAHPIIPPDAMRRELERPDVTLEELFQRYPAVAGTPAQAAVPAASAASSFDLAAHETVGGAAEALGWVNASGLRAEDRAALSRFINRFPGQQYFRVDDAWLDYVEGTREVRFPGWLRDFRKVLSYIKMPGVYFKLCFGQVGEEPVEGDAACYWANIRGPTSDEMPGVVQRARLYPLGDGGPGGQYTLAVGMDDDDRRVYRYRSEDGSNPDFSIEDATVAFPLYAAMFDHVVALLLPDGTRIEGAA